jgi:hypothetical protein
VNGISTDGKISPPNAKLIANGGGIRSRWRFYMSQTIIPPLILDQI